MSSLMAPHFVQYLVISFNSDNVSDNNSFGE